MSTPKFAYLAMATKRPPKHRCHMGNDQNRIREWRALRGLTLEQLAELVKLSPGYLQRMEVGDRNVSLKNLKKIAVALGVTERDLVSGTASRMCPLVGYVGAGAEATLFSEGHDLAEMVPAPDGATEKTVAVEIRGESLGAIFDRWLVFYDNVCDPPTSDLIGHLCVVTLDDGRVLVKQMKSGQLPKRFTLVSNTEPPIYDAKVIWAAKVKQMAPR